MIHQYFPVKDHSLCHIWGHYDKARSPPTCGMYVRITIRHMGASWYLSVQGNDLRHCHILQYSSKQNIFPTKCQPTESETMHFKVSIVPCNICYKSSIFHVEHMQQAWTWKWGNPRKSNRRGKCLEHNWLRGMLANRYLFISLQSKEVDIMRVHMWPAFSREKQHYLVPQNFILGRGHIRTEEVLPTPS